MRNFDLVKWEKGNVHVSQETIKDFESAIQSFSIISPIYNKPGYRKKVINKVLKTIFLRNNLYSNFIPVRLRKPKSGFAILMGDEFEKCLIEFFLKKENAVYFFDAWPSIHLEIERFIRSFNVKTVFFSSKRVTQTFQNKSLNIRSFWIPEAINADAYRYEPYDKKDIDVLQFGRKYDQYHNTIVDKLKKQGYSYLYEKLKGEIVFPTHADFLDGLARTKISICFPSSLTHPLRSGDISTMTVRYLQSMAAKCLIIGVMPEEMVELFDYMPILQVDFDNPVSQLLSVLENYDSYIPLIEKNYITVTKCHTWTQRSEKIIQLLASD